MLGPLHDNVVAKKRRLTEDTFNAFRKRKYYADFLVSANPDLMVYYVALGADQAFAAYDNYISRRTHSLTEEMLNKARQKAERNLQWWLKASEKHEQALGKVLNEAAMLGAKLAISGDPVRTMVRSMLPSHSEMIKEAEESTNSAMFHNGVFSFISLVEDDVDDYILPSFINDIA